MAKPKAKGTTKPAAAKTRMVKTRTVKPRTKSPASPKRAPAKRSAARPASDRLERLWLSIQEVREGLRASPRTARLLAGGPPKLAQKVVEEAGEVAIEAVTGARDAMIGESVDLLYNLVALWNGMGVEPKAVWAEMDRREAAFGMSEKLPKVEEI